MTEVALLACGLVAGCAIGFFIAGALIHHRALDDYHADVTRYNAAVDRYIAARYGDRIAAFQAELDHLEGWPR